MHAKLLERMTSSDDLKAYMDSEAGQRFLQASPLALEAANQQSVGAPFSRILWSVQMGVVMVALGGLYLYAPMRLGGDYTPLMNEWSAALPQQDRESRETLRRPDGEVRA